MRTKCGDYRAKMEAEEKTLRLAEPQFRKGKLDAKVFKRRVVLSSAGGRPQQHQATPGPAPSEQPQTSGFKFNFDVSEGQEQSAKSCSKEAAPSSPVVRQKITSGPYKSFNFQKSDNSFKFNFSGT